jgi:Arc-like DNA binding dprotein
VAKKPIRRAGRGSDQFIIRFPDGMRDQIAKLATANGRSMNAEIIDRLEKSMAEITLESGLKTFEVLVAQMSNKMDSVQENLDRILKEQNEG